MEKQCLSSKSKRRRRSLIFAAVGVLIALAAGLGGGLGVRRRYDVLSTYTEVPILCQLSG